jgi:uncharacterized membrane protein
VPLSTKIAAGSAMSIGLSLPLPPPPGVTLSLSNTSVTSGGSFNLTISVSPSTPVGNYPIVIDGLSGAVDHQAPIMLTVYSSNFSIQVSPAAATIIGGSSIPIAVSTASLDGGSTTIALSVANLPTGISASFSPATVTSGQSSTSNSKWEPRWIFAMV